MNAIIYNTNTGSTERYAKLFAHETGLPVCSFAEAKKAVPIGTEVIYFGWVMAGSVRGFAAAAKRYNVCAVCGVGMGQTGTQTENVRKRSAVPAKIPVLTRPSPLNIISSISSSSGVRSFFSARLLPAVLTISSIIGR